MINTFEPKLVGNTITMTTKFYDSANTEVIPDSVTLKYKKPDGTVQVSVNMSVVDSSTDYATLTGTTLLIGVPNKAKQKLYSTYSRTDIFVSSPKNKTDRKTETTKIVVSENKININKTYSRTKIEIQ